ncbi:hypothetical protein MSG28_004583 [Choristoneura fumiferana]|uniref:Uncharacterized protein n=1 Tax=Choristoneura fumiferana TaxID=7141 RepID=A0ACC0K6H7_CHOFU|nr:hypothetical protein MSG28_004583 [Choristoneura fumiferana]
MPKRGGGRNRNWKADGGDHFEHDDRTQHSNNIRRVSFKPGTSKGGSKFRSWKDPKLLLDDDIDMGANAGHGQGQGHMGPRKGAFRGRGGRLTPTPRRPGGPRKFIAGMLPWYQIIIPYGGKHPKEVILKALLGFISPEVFIPHYYKINGNAAVFYVDDVNVAEKLFNADRKIVMSDGFKLVVMVRNSVPNVIIDAEMKEKMKLIPYVSSLDPLKSLQLVELFLKGNPLVTRCSDHDIYVR